MGQAKGKVLSKLERKNVMENILPLVISLYRLLQRERSSLLRYILPFMSILMKEFKEEVNEVLGADKIIAQEIEFDLRQAEEAEAERARKEAIKVARMNSKRATPRIKSSVSFDEQVEDSDGHKSMTTSAHHHRRPSTGMFSRTPIPMSRHSTTKTAREKRRVTFGGNLAHITPLTARVVTTDIRPQLVPNTAPRLHASSARKAAAGSVSKRKEHAKDSMHPVLRSAEIDKEERRKVVLDNCTNALPSTSASIRSSTWEARRWSIEPSSAPQLSKLGIPTCNTEDDENLLPSQKDLTKELLQM